MYNNKMYLELQSHSVLLGGMPAASSVLCFIMGGAVQEAAHGRLPCHWPVN